jgi:hypothetical protein
VSEYVANNYAGFPAGFRVPLGPIPGGLEESLGEAKALAVFRPWRPEVDAIVTLPRFLVLIEAKIFKTMDGLSKLPVYKSLVPTTPELQPHKDKEILMELLVVKPLPWVEAAAAQNGVKLVAWAPPWVIEAFEGQDKYWTRDAVLQREERKKTLRSLGYE